MATAINRPQGNDLAAAMTHYVREHQNTPIYVATVVREFSQNRTDDENVRLTILELIASHRITLGPQLQLRVHE